MMGVLCAEKSRVIRPSELDGYNTGAGVPFLEAREWG
jgi:hypothetical protein